MKTLILITLSSFMSASSMIAEEPKVAAPATSTTVGTGIVAEFGPGTSLVLKETSGPVAYHYGKTVSYVTKNGTTIAEADLKTRIKVGSSVSVNYTTEGDKKILNKIVLDEY